MTAAERPDAGAPSLSEAEWEQQAFDNFAEDEGMAAAWIAIAVFTAAFAVICMAAGFALAKLL